jgi:hypothetical protein
VCDATQAERNQCGHDRRILTVVTNIGESMMRRLLSERALLPDPGSSAPLPAQDFRMQWLLSPDGGVLSGRVFTDSGLHPTDDKLF